jgi:hypothetical protein
MSDKKPIVSITIAITAAVLFGMLLRGFFDMDALKGWYDVMSITFLFTVPLGVGALTVFLSPAESVRRIPYRIFIPWVPVFLFLIITLLFKIEGLTCWLMVLPLFLLLCSVGGLISGYFKLQKQSQGKIATLIILALPFLLSPLEQKAGCIPTQYKADTYIDIKASKETVWQNLIRVRNINDGQNKAWLSKLLCFPRPMHAILNYDGIGASRQAVFTNGLVFKEDVVEYDRLNKLVFNVDADPGNIPASTMDEHVVIGGKYFDVVNGTYLLEELNDNTCRLHLCSRFTMNTTFNFFAGRLAKLIMKDIQGNLLQVIKARAEQDAKVI